MLIRMMSAVMMLSMVCCIAQAEKPANKVKKGKKGNQERVPQALALPDSIELTADQEAQVKKIRAKFSDKAKDLKKQTQEVIPAELRKQQAAAVKAAKEAGKSQEEIRQIMKSSQDELSAVDREKLAVIRKQSQALKTEFLKEVREVLTEEQQSKLPTAREGKGKGKKPKKSDS
ncbi:hypothetical protein [Rubinisphaera italica]|uniref:LTXXQ motif protein n=1 Tax=Rubinisphaera italica TaxID=2527969 RepID=A0A5C5XB91_9PLAN|nr:hypothetical protein [Rubinisphaera italica]TWT60417.1 hypothetical protein Pan54_11310 [Rubinisphaera italica]